MNLLPSGAPLGNANNIRSLKVIFADMRIFDLNGETFFVWIVTVSGEDKFFNWDVVIDVIGITKQ
jgi:hypothetical protein